MRRRDNTIQAPEYPYIYLRYLQDANQVVEEEEEEDVLMLIGPV
jgi:hypothetical protein